MRRAHVYMHGELAGMLTESDDGVTYAFAYGDGYRGPPVSLTMPVVSEPYTFTGFPPFFDGLLPEGHQLEGLLRQAKLDRPDRLSQLLAVGGELVGAVTVEAAP
jgi:serine/threonine-protein kinase HipA